MSDVYKRLAQKLDDTPNGFPSTDDGIELKLLQKVFTPEEAEVAVSMSASFVTAEAIAESIGKTIEGATAALEDMASKGLISKFQYSGQTIYRLEPFFPGIYEMQIWMRPDKEFIELWQAYYPALMKGIGAHGPAMTRVIPIQERVHSESQVQPYEDVRKVIEQAKSFATMDCTCRKEQAVMGRPCGHTVQNCLHLPPVEDFYDDPPFGGKAISRKEALDILDKAEEEGLVHNGILNHKEGFGVICNCCPCCCVPLKGAKLYGTPYLIARSNYVALIDTDTCIACGVCAEERCPVGAVTEDDGAYRVSPGACIGCGACTVTCSTESITLITRPESERIEPPEDKQDWSIKRVAGRSKV